MFFKKQKPREFVLKVLREIEDGRYEFKEYGLLYLRDDYHIHDSAKYLWAENYEKIALTSSESKILQNAYEKAVRNETEKKELILIEKILKW